MDLAADPPRQRSIASRLYIDATIHKSGVLTVLFVAERLQRHCLQQWLLLGEHHRHPQLGSAMDSLVGRAFLPVVQVPLCSIITPNTIVQVEQGQVSRVVDRRKSTAAHFRRS
jgi:hypothetical protein